MIRYNHVTELCMTQGQEGYVVSWTVCREHIACPVIDTLFIALHNPLFPVQIPGLPPNVVPITKNHTKITLSVAGLPQVLNINRKQVNMCYPTLL